MVWRWFVGLLRRLVNLWDGLEWAYYARVGLDPTLPAFRRWELKQKAAELPPDAEDDGLLPQKTYTLILHDKYGLTAEDVLYFSTDLGRVEVLHKRLDDELQSRNSAWFWHYQIVHRNFDFIHGMRLGEDLAEGVIEEEDAEAMRRDFFRQR
jgi:hypothetical protein